MPKNVYVVLGMFAIAILVVWYMRRKDKHETQKEVQEDSESILDFTVALNLFLKFCNNVEPPVALVITFIAENGRRRQVFVWVKPGCKADDLDTRTREILNSTVSIEVFDETKPSHLQTAVPAYHKFGHAHAEWSGKIIEATRHGSLQNLPAINPVMELQHAFFTAVFRSHPRYTLEVQAAVSSGNKAGIRGGTGFTMAALGASVSPRPSKAFMPDTETIESMPAIKSGRQADGSMIIDMKETVAAPRQVSVPARPPQQRR